MSGHRAAEAFKRMLYRCERGHEEWIWNSRDGVTPFVVQCATCGRAAEHVDWNRDQYRPLYDPAPGERYFRDGLPEEARGLAQRRLEAAVGTPYEVPEDQWAALIEQIVTPDEWGGEFAPGWPKLVVRGSDADALPLEPPGDGAP